MRERAMPVVFTCYHCGGLVSVPEQWVGFQACCPACAAVNVVPGPAAAPPPPPRSYAPADREYGPPHGYDRPPRRLPPPRVRRGGSGVLLAVLLGVGGLVLLGGFLCAAAFHFAARNARNGNLPPGELPPGWTRTEWREGRCRFATPAPPRDLTRDPEDGRVIRAKIVEHSQGIYWVSYTPLTEGIPDDEAAEGTFDRVRNTLLEEDPSTRLISERPCPLGDHPGREFIYAFSEPGGGPLRRKTRMFIVGDRMYMVSATGAPSWVDSANAARFLDSFELSD
jgi:hypothetical protein